MAETLAEKVWNRHVVRAGDGAAEPDLLYIDLHLVHEVTSPQAFEGLRMAGRRVRRPDLTIATADHNVPTTTASGPVEDEVSRRQLEALDANCSEFGVTCYPMGHEDQGIVHVIGPEQGLTQPGMTIVCGDSHTSTHGAFGALAFGIGTSEVEHVLATQTLPQRRSRTMAVTVDGVLPLGVGGKDLVLAIVGRLGTTGGAGHLIEYRGSAIRSLSMEGRMTVCNMSIEAGAKAGMIAPDDVTFEYLEGRRHSPKGSDWDRAVEEWRGLVTDEDGRFDTEIVLDAALDPAPRVVGDESRPGRRHRRRRAEPGRLSDSRRTGGRCARPRLHGSRGRHSDPLDRGGHRLHRLLHQFADRGLEDRGRRARRPSRPAWTSRPRRTRFPQGQAPG